MPQLKTPTATSSSSPNGTADSMRTLNGVNYALNALKDLYDVRLDGMDKAITVAHEDLVRVPTDVDKAVGSLEKVINEKFATVNERFTVVQTQFDEREKALAAALLTAEKAVGKQAESFTAATDKSEAAATKQADALSDRLNSSESTSNDKHAATQAQISRLDNTLTVFTSSNMGRSGAVDNMWARLVAAACIGGGLIGLIQFLARN